MDASVDRWGASHRLGLDRLAIGLLANSGIPLPLHEKLPSKPVAVIHNHIGALHRTGAMAMRMNCTDLPICLDCVGHAAWDAFRMTGKLARIEEKQADEPNRSEVSVAFAAKPVDERPPLWRPFREWIEDGKHAN